MSEQEEFIEPVVGFILQLSTINWLAEEHVPDLGSKVYDDTGDMKERMNRWDIVYNIEQWW